MSDYSVLVENLLECARAARHRHTLVLSGDREWCRRAAREILAETQITQVLWVSDIQLENSEVLSGRDAKALLGQERELVVFDAHAGFDPDAFGAVSGIIPGGGLLLLLCPPLAAWEQYPDPASERIATWPCEAKDISGRFIRRLVNILRQARGVTLLEQDQPVPGLGEADAATPALRPGLFASEDQQVAIEAIEHVMHGHSHRPLVLVSDRGRGKSSALGIAAANLLLTAESPLRIVVTAPRLDAVNTLFAQARRLLPNAAHSADYLEYRASTIEYYAPDVLCQSELDADLLLVDEAAAIPTNMLQQLLNTYARMVFATTVHGYEGTGRGFAVRFRHTLSMQTPGWRELTLRMPFRWAEDDPLEQMMFRALLLDAECAPDLSVQAATLDEVRVERVERDALLTDETSLAQCFGLLVVAHYRTTPNDLRNLLDGPGLSVYVSRYQGQVVATALVSAEGPLDDDIAAAIYEGRRRPRGNLLPQSLITHLGIRAAARLRCARVMRIAVHPMLRRNGLGKKLIEAVRAEVRGAGFDLIGASFGATDKLMDFWQQVDMWPVRVGFKRDHASGEHSVMVLQPLSETGEKVYRLARRRVHRDLPHWLADPLRDLDTSLAQALLHSGHRTGAAPIAQAVLSRHDRDMLHAFAQGWRSYEDSLGPMWRLCARYLGRGQDGLDAEESKLLTAKLLQHRIFPEVAASYGYTGRAEVLDALRKAVGRMLDAVSGPTK